MKLYISVLILVGISISLVFVQHAYAPKGVVPIVVEELQSIFPHTAEDQEISLLFVGDIMMDRHIRTVAEREGYDFYFSCVKPSLEKYDFVIGNVEGPVTTSTSVSRVKTVEDPNLFRFTMSPEVPTALLRAGFDVVSIDNNHMYDFGREGLLQTITHMSAARLSYFGDRSSDIPSVYATTTRGITTHFISFNEFFGSATETIELVKSVASSSGTIIVFAHWGDEYVPASARVKAWAREFIDAGADVVIGSHPHVVQEFELYNDRPIFYSLGNFVFDQYFMESVKNGGAAEIVIKSTGEIVSRLLPVYLDEENRPCISE